MKKRHIINQDKRIITSVSENKISLNEEFMNKFNKNSTAYEMLFYSISDEELFKEKSFHGVAKCCEEDDFNVRTGTEIADLKCDLAYNEWMSKRYNEILYKLEKDILRIRHIKNAHVDKSLKLKHELEKITKE